MTMVYIVFTTSLGQLVSRLGGQMATSPLTCSHLVAPSVIRTVKFLVAFSSAKHVVKPEWIEKSIQHGQFLGKISCANLQNTVCFFMELLVNT